MRTSPSQQRSVASRALNLLPSSTQSGDEPGALGLQASINTSNAGAAVRACLRRRHSRAPVPALLTLAAIPPAAEVEVHLPRPSALQEINVVAVVVRDNGI